MPGSIHGDLSVRATADTSQMPWTASPSGSVRRKRVHLVGAPEAGQVTSVVRYESDSHSPHTTIRTGKRSIVVPCSARGS